MSDPLRPYELQHARLPSSSGWDPTVCLSNKLTGDSNTDVVLSHVDQPESSWFRSDHTEGMDVASCGPYVDKGGFFFSEDSKSPVSTLATIPATECCRQCLWLFLFVHRTVRLSLRLAPASISSCLLRLGPGAGPWERTFMRHKSRK